MIHKMIKNHNEISPEIKEWASYWAVKDKDYLQQRARFAPEPVKSIAKLVLSLADRRL